MSTEQFLNINNTLKQKLSYGLLYMNISFLYLGHQRNAFLSTAVGTKNSVLQCFLAIIHSDL